MMTRQQIAERIRHGRGLIDGHAHLGVDPASFDNGDFPYAITAEDHGVRMMLTGVGCVLCFPFTYTAYFHLKAWRNGQFRHDPRGAPVPYEPENARLCREIYEAFPEFTGRLLPFGCFDPARRPAEQAAAFRELAGRYPLFGLKTATSYLQSHITALLGKGACLLDLAAELDIPVTIHSSVLPGDPWANVFEILKVVKRRPDVRFAIAHTCRFDQRALEMAADLGNCFVDVAAFHIHCLLAQQNHPAVAAKPDRFPADYRNHAETLQRLAEAYPTTILWGTDTPGHLFKSRFHNEQGETVLMDLPCGPLTEVEELHKLPPRLQQQIGHTNTVRFLFGDAARKPTTARTPATR